MRIHMLFSFLLLSSTLSAQSYSLALSADTTRFDYAETEGGQLLDTETNDFGDITGLTLSLEAKENGWYLSTNYSSGQTDYIGGTNLNPAYGSHITTTDNTIIDYNTGYKITALLDPRAEVKMPFKIGVGYREWLREIHNTPLVWGVDELYDWGYLDIGVGLHFAIAENATLGIDANYRKAFNAQMYENLYGTTFDLNNVYGYKIVVPLEIALNSSLSAFFHYNYEYWSIGASNVVSGFYEPDSETKNQTLSLGVKYYF